MKLWDKPFLIKPRTKERVSIRQFWKEWRQGMEKVTPLQQAVITQWGFIISTIGIVWGIIFSIRVGYKWMALILIAGLIIVAMQFLGNWQKKTILKRMEDAYNMAEAETQTIEKEEIKNG